MHPTCYCYWLANSFGQFLPQDACASVDVLNLFVHLNCIALSYCLVFCISPLQSPMSTSIFILLPSLSARGFHLVLLTCIELHYCIVYLHILPQSSVSTGFTILHTHMSACVYFSCRKDDLFCLAIVYYSL